MSIRKVLPLSHPVPSVLLLATLSHLGVAVVTHSAWLLTGNMAWLHYFFGYQSPVFFISFSIVEFALAIIACQQFSPGQSLRTAWMLIALAGACHLLGAIVSHLLCTDSYLNPLFALRPELFDFSGNETVE